MYPRWEFLKWDGPILLTGCNGFKWHDPKPILLIAIAGEFKLFLIEEYEVDPDELEFGYDEKAPRTPEGHILLPELLGGGIYREGDTVGQWGFGGGQQAHFELYHLARILSRQEFQFATDLAPEAILDIPSLHECPESECFYLVKDLSPEAKAKIREKHDCREIERMVTKNLRR